MNTKWNPRPLIRRSAAVFVLALALAKPAAAQWGNPYAAPMDMSGLMANQMYLGALGDQMAQQAGLAAFQMMQDIRRQTEDWTTPFAPIVSPQALQNSINGANEATQRFIQSGAASSASRANSASNWSTLGILGQNEVYNPWTGATYQVDDGYNTYFQGPYGTVWGTDSNWAPNGTTVLTPRW